MAKKNFSKGIDAFLSPQKSQIRDETQKKNNKKMIRTTLRLDHDLMEAIKAIAYWNRQTSTDIISQALQKFIGFIDQETLKQALEKYKEHQENQKQEETTNMSCMTDMPRMSIMS